MKSGIYHIYCNKNNKGYVGSSYNILQRWNNHNWRLKNNKHPNKHLQNAYNKYGAESFEFTIILSIPTEYIIKMEQWIKDKSVYNSEFNMRKLCESNRGIKLSEATKEKIRIKAIGRTSSIETKIKLSNIKKEALKSCKAVEKNLANFGINGPSFPGSKNGNSKINETDALNIINRLNSGEHPKNISIDFPIGINLIYAIKAKKAWRHLQ